MPASQVWFTFCSTCLKQLSGSWAAFNFAVFVKAQIIYIYSVYVQFKVNLLYTQYIISVGWEQCEINIIQNTMYGENTNQKHCYIIIRQKSIKNKDFLQIWYIHKSTSITRTLIIQTILLRVIHILSPNCRFYIQWRLLLHQFKNCI